MVRLEFELAYYDVAVQHVSLYIYSPESFFKDLADPDSKKYYYSRSECIWE